MKTYVVLAIRAACASLFALVLHTTVLAQDVSRDDVRAQTRDAAKKHELLPAGESATVPTPASKSTRTRAQRKAGTAAARSSNDLLPAGEASTTTAARKHAASERSTKTRAQRKEDTLSAVKAKQTIPAGEAISKDE